MYKCLGRKQDIPQTALTRLIIEGKPKRFPGFEGGTLIAQVYQGSIIWYKCKTRRDMRILYVAMYRKKLTIKWFLAGEELRKFKAVGKIPR